MRTMLSTLVILGLSTFCCVAVSAQSDDIDPTTDWVKPVVEKKVEKPVQTKPAQSIPTQNVIVAPDGMKPEPGLYTKPCNCQAQFKSGKPPDTQHKKHKLLKALGHELGMEMTDLGKDMFMAFSVNGIDPYDGPPQNPKVPYVAASAQFINGNLSHMWKYPDGSWRVDGGFLDGTYACQQPDGLFIVQYPNGARGTMKLTSTGGEIIRPDNTITTFTQSGQSMRMVNSKLGYMGEVQKDSTGLSYEFARQNF